ncbi:UNVERIFIED_CONTAM: hypothetical protein Slati_3837300 [Sesamum latifolium]|uniref:Uncharacterized protein n=1 Tax=Sesamum latifolium TaxID=2727402 RepID=A0AAW2TKU2_9LAMI
MLADAGLSQAKAATTPLPTGIKFTSETRNALPDPESYKRYLEGSTTKGLVFPATVSTDLVEYCDVDWASCLDSKRSLTGYGIFLGSALTSWKTKKTKHYLQIHSRKRILQHGFYYL